jgi:hypothetical protein
MKRSRGEDCLSDLKLDRILRGEIGKDAHLDGCELCGARYREIEAQRERFQANAKPLKRPVWRFVAAGSTALAAAAALVVMLIQPDGTRVKGAASIQFHVQHGDVARPGQNGEVVAPGDTLQFRYKSAAPFYGAILSVDGAGKVSRYFPDGPTAAALPAGEHPLPRSTILDAVLGKETLYALFCADPVALDPLQAQLAAKQPLDAAGCRVERIEIEKQ